MKNPLQAWRSWRASRSWWSPRRLGRALYEKLVLIDDDPAKVALGFGIGVFFGILPGLGILATFLTAALVKANRASALLGNLITSFWLSVLVLGISVQVGAWLMGMSAEDVRDRWSRLAGHRDPGDLWRTSTYDVLIPVLAGYLLVSVVMGLAAYGSALWILNKRRR